MKVETPQILWHSEKKNLPAALLSIDMIDSGIDSRCLVTSGSSDAIHVWKIAHNNTEFLCALSRHDGPVNKVLFSPNGLYLATAGDTGNIIVYSVPFSKRGNSNGQHYWSGISRENDLDVNVVYRNGEAVTDVSWSADSKRLLACTIDRKVVIIEFDGAHHKQIYLNNSLHTHFIQGVSYDPLGSYLVSSSCDRTVRVLCQKKKIVKTRQIKYHDKNLLFGDEATLESFFRRLNWTPDGQFLICPAGLWGKSYATFLFARHKFDEPARVLGGLEKPSICVRPNPLLWKIPDCAKENDNLNHPNSSSPEYRSIFAVLTWDEVVLYDTHHDTPIGIVRGIHYSSLVDATWSADGRTLAVCSTDGYITWIRFEDGELGEVYHPPKPVEEATIQSSPKKAGPVSTNVVKSPPVPPLPPCEPGQVGLTEPPAKRLKTTPTVTLKLPASSKNNGKKRVQPTLVEGS